MTWRQRYLLRTWLASSIWPVPVAAMVVGIGAVLPAVRWIDATTGWTLPATTQGAQLVGGTLTGALLSFIVIVFSTLLLTVQVASAHMTPRLVYRVFADTVTKSVLGLFVLVYSVALGTLARLSEPVPMFGGLVTAYGSLLSLAFFIFLIDWVASQLRPSQALVAIGRDGERVIDRLYPKPFGGEPRPSPRGSDRPALAVEHQGRTGVLLSFDRDGLSRWASRAGVTLELVPMVGHFVTRGDVLFNVYGRADGLREDALRNGLAFGNERTLTQDPAFAFRVIVDIACKALSRAINDPTTAVAALDQIQHLLRRLGERDLDDRCIVDDAGRTTLTYALPDWEDFVTLSVTEIRHYGADSVQVVRRLKAMLAHLIEVLPAARHPALRHELAALERDVRRSYPDPIDQARAATGDTQGVG